MSPGPLTWWHTVRHLRASQVGGRLRFRLTRPTVDARPAPAERPGQRAAWVMPAGRRPSLIAPGRFDLLGVVHDLAHVGWDDEALPKLWRYHQHYFDDVNAAGAADRDEWHRSVCAAWLAGVEPGRGSGWDPYPTSLRIVNWVKWHLRTGQLPPGAWQSLAVQARCLAGRIEWHLLGNHLMSNAKALVCAGAVFDGPEADAWRATGLQILARELPEQVLADGGHFERSPMYHALAFEDVLDLINLSRVYPTAISAPVLARLKACAPRMHQWLRVMCHPDGEIAFFNDAAFGVAPTPSDLDAYAARLGYGAPVIPAGVVVLRDSGYIRVSSGESVVLLDVAPVGPDYLPAHAHADTLSFEWSWRGHRVLVNSGTSEYGAGPERHRQRGTAAHNTVVVGAQNSSEVWAGFRVGRRARPRLIDLHTEPPLRVEAAHDGYRHVTGTDIVRSWSVGAQGVEVDDQVGHAGATAEARFHLHPSVSVSPGSLQPGACELQTAEGGVIRVAVAAGSLDVESSTWHPAFGQSEPASCLVVRLESGRAQTSFRCG